MLIPIYEHRYISICLYNLHQYFIVFIVPFFRAYFSPLLLSFIIVIQSLSHVQLSVTPQTAACQAPLYSSRVCSNSCQLSLWCYRTISSSAAPFFFLQSYPASGSFPMNWLFTSSDKSTGASAREKWIFRVDFL